ncbi:hypothetical protein SS50377_20485 [Spironucleus salmonicida]|uniref:Uncharacterized protein n=1 Tax=Spironucleus salmonicida TaxID=348837 RepID=A0A9P8LZL3_9EUKA|nr:hypothetical protein SS50377_20485 [Spironucleus salmonicida]
MNNIYIESIYSEQCSVGSKNGVPTVYIVAVQVPANPAHEHFRLNAADCGELSSPAMVPHRRQDYVARLPSSVAKAWCLQSSKRGFQRLGQAVPCWYRPSPHAQFSPYRKTLRPLFYGVRAGLADADIDSTLWNELEPDRFRECSRRGISSSAQDTQMAPFVSDAAPRLRAAAQPTLQGRGRMLVLLYLFVYFWLLARGRNTSETES